MFDAISQTVKTGNSDSIAPKPGPVKSPDPPPTLQRSKKEVEKKAEAMEPKVSQEFLDTLEKDIDMIHNVGLQFSVDHSTGRTIIKVIDKDTGQLIREVPPESVLNLSAKLDEMMGILFDKTV